MCIKYYVILLMIHTTAFVSHKNLKCCCTPKWNNGFYNYPSPEQQKKN